MPSMRVVSIFFDILRGRVGEINGATIADRVEGSQFIFGPRLTFLTPLDLRLSEKGY